MVCLCIKMMTKRGLTKQKRKHKCGKLSAINEDPPVKAWCCYERTTSRNVSLLAIQESNKRIGFKITLPITQTPARRKTRSIVNLQCIASKMDWLRVLLIAAIVFGKFFGHTGCDDAQDFQRNSASFLTTAPYPLRDASIRHSP